MNNRRVIERKNQQQKPGLRAKRFQVVAGAKPGVVPLVWAVVSRVAQSTGTVALRHNVPVNGFLGSFHHSND